MERRVVVLSTPLWSRLEKSFIDLPEVVKIKQVKMNGFYWINNDATPEENCKFITSKIHEMPNGKNMAFKVYPIIAGKIDMDKSDMTREQKMQTPFFKTGKKDITEEELASFASAHNF